MAYKLPLLLAGGYAASVMGQTFIVSACSTVSGQQVCQGPSGTPVTFTGTAPTSATPAPSSASITSGPATTSAAATFSSASMSVTAISECHYHGNASTARPLHVVGFLTFGKEPFCFAGTAEFEILDAPTRTEELPAQYTACHSHGSEMFCVSPSGQDVEVRAEGASEGEGHSEENHSGEDGHDHGSNSTTSSSVATGASATATGGASGALDCHFHGGVEHCVPIGGSESDTVERNCERQTREYNIPLRVGMLFVVLATSSIAVFTPILMSSILKHKIVSFVLLQLKQFGTGVLVSTAFVHLYTHAELMLTNSCITWPERYEGTTAAIVMAGIFLSFLVEYVGSRIIMRMGHGTINEVASRDSSADSGEETSKSTAGASLAHLGHGGHNHVGTFYMHPQQQKLSVVVIEAGIIFHSILIGLTLIVAGDSVFGSLVVVIIFHQMFEGLALGTRIAELPSTNVNGHEPVSMPTKYLFAGLFAVITPLGMAIGLAALKSFNGNDPSTLIAIGTLDAVSAGILAWVALVEMWAGDWLHGPLARADLNVAAPSMVSLMFGMIIMSVLGKWA
ncbi:Anthranilate synthase component 1 [Sphaceloma murrayae]|uniref:Anthranilate synthase component 1 n=1 Tax=Sphaceloma murrayae TaxID=2082308 RepID=A0A2K1QNJ0_9PEZI|nr:Anthranilate synthase component 1 [Sphaceloma murrayae]